MLSLYGHRLSFVVGYDNDSTFRGIDLKFLLGNLSHLSQDEGHVMKQVVKSIVRHESSLSTAVPWNLEDLRDGLGSPTRVITGRSRLARRFASACRLNCVGSLVQIVNPRVADAPRAC